ncbi:hypothetical protein ARMSODRAFT_974574 [Armillaria solidipes]|uniref:Uncharacterized protein n=1 Tax=Armillaria solidipes TaxID=1076256 RepID=A0A2H3BZQ9_9AGAR|nr:hypothetical protein ARMSODRAFT_974574 [Armillaria solidipes]
MLLSEEEKTWTKLSEETHAVAMNKWKAGGSRKKQKAQITVLISQGGRLMAKTLPIRRRKGIYLKTVVPSFGGFLKKAIDLSIKRLHQHVFGDIERDGAFLHRVEVPSTSVEPPATAPGATDSFKALNQPH